MNDDEPFSSILKAQDEHLGLVVEEDAENESGQSNKLQETNTEESYVFSSNTSGNARLVQEPKINVNSAREMS